MKRLITLSIIICMLISLSALSGMFANSSDVAEIVVIDVMGIDASGTGVSLTLSHTGSGEEDRDSVFTASGSTVSDAMKSITDFSYKGEIFPAHIESIILGAGSEDRLGDVLSFICSSPEIIIDVPLFILNNSHADQAIIESGESIGSILTTLTDRAKAQNSYMIFTAAEIADNLKTRGCSLVTTLELKESSESVEGEEGKTVGFSGYTAVNVSGKLGYIPPSLSLGAAILSGGVGMSQLTVCSSGEDVTVNIYKAVSSRSAVWNKDGELESIEIAVSFSASAALGNEDIPSITTAVKLSIASSVMDNIRLSRQLGYDIFNFSSAIEKSSPGKYRKSADRNSLYLQDKYVVTVKGNIDRTNDIKEGIF